MAINELPEELLARVLNNLRPSDRIGSALACRRWAEIVSTSELMDDVRLNIAGFEISKASAVLGRSRRQYRHLQLYRAELYSYNYNAQFWNKVSENLRDLELIDCCWSPRVFYRILRLCPKLESLRIVESLDPPKLWNITVKDFEIPEDSSAEEIRESLNHLKHLGMHIFVKRDMLEYLLGLMPNVKTISLSRFERNSDFLKHLREILKPDQKITGLRAGYMRLSDEEMIHLLDVAGGSLEELRMDCGALSPEGFVTISRFTALRHLSLEGEDYDLEDDQMKHILANVPNLESFTIHDSSFLSNGTLSALATLKKLRRLKISDYWMDEKIAPELMCNLAKISTLRELDMRGFDVTSPVLRLLACLDLRVLRIDSSPFESDCLEIICENFKRLEGLELGCIEKLTDDDGRKFSRLKELRSLSFSHAVGLTDRTFEEGVGSPNMKHLSISGCHLTDIGLASIAAHHGVLKRLRLVQCEKITDAGLVKLLRREAMLEELFQHCICLKERWIRALVKLCPRLRILDVDYGTTGTAVAWFMARRPAVDIFRGPFVLDELDSE